MNNLIVRIAVVTGFIAGSFQASEAKTFHEKQRKWEFSVNSGRLFSAGTQPKVVKGADYTAAQLAYVLRPNLAITGSLGWARSRDISVTASPKLDIFTYDIGAEARGNQRSLGSGISFSPFVGAGLGARSYSYRNLAVETANRPAGYVSAGGEFGYHRIRLRLEVRDYVSAFKPLNGRGQEVRNDMTVMVGIRLAQR